jgi:hypothetical protein
VLAAVNATPRVPSGAVSGCRALTAAARSARYSIYVMAVNECSARCEWLTLTPPPQQAATRACVTRIDGRIFAEAVSHRSSQARALVIVTAHDIER